MERTPEMTKLLDEVSAMLEIMVKERTYLLRLEIDSLQMQIKKEQQTQNTLWNDRNEIFKLWDENKWKVHFAIETLESLLSSWNSNGDFYDYVALNAINKLKEEN